MDILTVLPFTIRQLQYLVAVADLGAFGRAAEHCHVSQPSLSAQIAQVEDALGIRIFERDRRRVRLSTAGAVIVEKARRALVASHEIADAAQQQADPFAGTVRIGVIPTVCPYLLPEVTSELRTAYPRLTIVWTEERTPSLLRLLGEGRVDAAVLALGAGTNDLESVELCRDQFVLAAARDHPLARKAGPVKPQALDEAEVLLLEDGHCFRDQALAWCSRAGAVEADYRATSLATLVQMVGGGGGVTLLPELAVPVENRKGHLAIRRFATPAPSRTIGLMWRRGAARQPALEGVGRTMRKALGSRVAAGRRTGTSDA